MTQGELAFERHQDRGVDVLVGASESPLPTTRCSLPTPWLAPGTLPWLAPGTLPWLPGSLVPWPPLPYSAFRIRHPAFGMKGQTHRACGQYR